jgi:hypothetical protein
MNRQEILNLITQAAAALTAEPPQDAKWTEGDRQMLKDVHAATVQPQRTAGLIEPTQYVPIPYPEEKVFTSESVEPAKKSWWKKLGSGMKTAIVALGAGGGGAALSAVVDQVKDGNISPTGLATAAIGAAVAGAIGYRSKPPAKGE